MKRRGGEEGRRRGGEEEVDYEEEEVLVHGRRDTLEETYVGCVYARGRRKRRRFLPIAWSICLSPHVPWKQASHPDVRRAITVALTRPGVLDAVLELQRTDRRRTPTVPTRHTPKREEQAVPFIELIACSNLHSLDPGVGK